MFELDRYSAAIARAFGPLMARFQLRPAALNEHVVRLSGSACNIELLSERYAPDLLTLLVDPARPERSYSLVQVLTKKGLMGQKLLTAQESAILDDVTDALEREIHFSALLVAKVAIDLLSGDFSVMA